MRFGELALVGTDEDEVAPVAPQTSRERVLEAMIAVVECDADDPVAYRRAWERFRRASLAWHVATAGGRGKLAAAFRESRREPPKPSMRGAHGPGAR